MVDKRQVQKVREKYTTSELWFRKVTVRYLAEKLGKTEVGQGIIRWIRTAIRRFIS